MKPLTLTALWALLVSIPALGEVLVDTDFGTCERNVNAVSDDGRTDVNGSLPESWIENSTGPWQPAIAIRYEPREEDGVRFLRVTKGADGALQIATAIATPSEPTWFRLRYTARSAALAAPEVGLRFDGAPYTTVWQTTTALSPGWQEYTREFRLEPPSQAIRLQVLAAGACSFDLAHLTLERFTRAELVERIRAEHPEGSSGNLARITRFPLGVPSGWLLSREDDDAQVVVSGDASVPGPSGSPSLHVRAPGSFVLLSAPFAVPWSFETHVLSVDLRGTGTAHIAAIGEAGRPLATREVTLGNEWRRESLAFEPSLGGEVHGLRVDGAGELWLDGLQVERGTEPTAYRPSAVCETVLALPESDASRAGVQFADEPTSVRIAVTGAEASAVQVRVEGPSGEPWALPPVALAAADTQFVEVDWAAGREPGFGPFRIEGCALDVAGAPLGQPYEVIVHRLRRPRFWGRDAPESPFGVHTLPATRHLTMAKAVGINWVRLHDAGMQYIGWSFLEPERGQWQFFDEEIRRYRAAGLMICGQLETAPYWATGYPRPCSGYWDRWFQPNDLDAWSEYVRTVAERYRDEIRHWEVWNEPWGSFWSIYDPAGPNEQGRSPSAAADYAKLQAAAYQAAKSVDPGLTIVGFNSYGGYNGKDWTREVLEAGGWESCDVFSYHKYTSATLGYPGDDVSADGLAHAAAPILETRGGLDKPAWMSEGTPLRYSTWDGVYRHTLPYPNTDRWRSTADDTVRYLVSTLSGGAEKVFLYTMHSLDYYHGSGQPQWRCLVTNDGALHPAGDALSALAWLIEGTRFVRIVEPAEGVYAYLFEGGGRAVAAICPKPGHAAWSLPEGSEGLDLFGNALGDRAVGEHTCYLVGETADELARVLGGGGR